jgi:dTDP-4-dehydrorhamnose 3,5-epimerase
MQAHHLAIKEVLVLEPKIFSDDRGYFFESFNLAKFRDIIGRDVNFVQDNRSVSKLGVLRGLHYQVVKPQGKLVSVLAGEVFDVAIDLRDESKTYGMWVGEILSAANKKMLWIPEGFAHGYLVLSEFAEFYYKVTDYWYPEHERCIRFDDRQINIIWPKLSIAPILSEKDLKGTVLPVK